MQLEHQRGQTLPFWSVGTVIVLAMLFFLANYVNVVTWNIRAQTAADSFASEGLGITSNLYNEYSTLTYAAAVDEYRIRSLNQAILNTMMGMGCDASSGGSCDQDYATLVQQYNSAYAAYDKLVQAMRQGDNLVQAGTQSDQQKAERQMGADCTSTTDYVCNFKPYVVARGFVANGGYPDEIDVIACHAVPYYVPQLLRLGGGSSFNSMARAGAAVVPIRTQTFSPGSEISPVTGQPFQPVETPAPDTNTAYRIDYSNVTTKINWYAPAPIRPFGGAVAAGTYSC